MKAKYENHIEDLELHVNDLKSQLKRKSDTYDLKSQKKVIDGIKEDAHLLATIRGFQADLSNKEKVIGKLQKEIDDLKKTNRRLQKEREGSLRNLNDKREFRSYPEKLYLQTRSNSISSEKDFRKEEELQQVKSEREKLKQQLSRLEQDYQALKTKRIQDLPHLTVQSRSTADTLPPVLLRYSRDPDGIHGLESDCTSIIAII
ncbi:hypothetical protein NQ317_000229, partial [Molorchus minor]